MKIIVEYYTQLWNYHGLLLKYVAAVIWAWEDLHFFFFFFYNTLVPINNKTTIVSKSEKLLLCRRHQMPDGDAASPQARRQT